MAYETLEMLIDGQWVQGSGGRTQAVVNPATEEAFAQVPLAEAADLDRAIEASTRAFKTWGKTTPFERQAIMEKAARLLEERKDAIAETLTRENGKPLAEAKAEIDVTIGFTRWFGEEAKRSYGRLIPARSPGARQMAVKEPVGPASAFVAWNFPGSNVIKKLSAAMAAGCTLIMKPAEETPGTAVALARAYHDAGLPAGVLNIVFGVPSDVSEHVLASPHIKKMSFTGSVPVGKHLARLAADNLIRTTMELGGHAPVVVFDDADIENALNSMHAFKFRNAGQVCISPTRFYVQQDVYNRFVEGFTERVNAMQVGNGLDANTNMGPLIAQRRLEVMEEFVADAKDHGATVATGGERIGNQGYFYAPTVLKD
ncbi:MAG: aldehyde dehydrogenase family protein, partial [Pseudomonadota bacterium]